MRKYIAIISSNSSLGREYEVDTRSVYKVAQELGRCEGGEVIQIRTVGGRILSEARWMPENGGRYYRCEVSDEKNTSRIARLRTMAGLTQKELAGKVGGSYQWVQRLEAGSIDIGNITLQKALALADALGVEVRELISGD